MWKIVKNFLQRISDESLEIRFASASLAFSTLIALIPFMILTLSAFQAVGGIENYYSQAELLVLGYLKEATGTTVTQYFKSTLSQVKIKTIGVSSVLFLLITTLSLLRSVDIAFHKIWGINTHKPFHRRMWLYSLIMIGTPIGLALYMGLRSVNYVKMVGQAVEHQFIFSLWAALILWLMYTLIPDTKVSKLASMISALVASAALSIIQGSFFWIAVKLFRQNTIYGSLASLPIFLIWLLVIWYVVLTGVSLCAFLQQKIFKRS